MILFGFRNSVRRIAVLMLFCRNCNGTFAAALDKITTKFTLFFVPLLPLRVRRSLTCTRCATTQRITRTDAERLRQDQVS